MENKLYELLQATAMEKFASEEEREAFLEGFGKEVQASQLDLFGNAVGGVLKNPETWGKPLAGLAVGLAGVGIARAISSAGGAVSTMQLRAKYDTALSQVMASNKVVRSYDPAKAKRYADTIFQFSPHVAADPNLLSSILANAILGEGIDPITIKTLVDLEGRYRDNTSQKPLMGFKV